VVLRCRAVARKPTSSASICDIALQVRAGEVVGIAGVSGNGQKELLYALSGEDTRAAPAMVQVLGKGVGAWARAGAVRWACISCRKSAWAAAPCPAWAWRTTCC
jgi:ABC-type uncharacterized transport system ATPase subunit